MIEYIKRHMTEFRDRNFPIRAASLEGFAHIVNREGGTMIQARAKTVIDHSINSGWAVDIPVPDRHITEYRSVAATGRGIQYVQIHEQRNLFNEEKAAMSERLYATALDRMALLRAQTQAEVVLLKEGVAVTPDEEMALLQQLREKGVEPYPYKQREE